jgi:hypothetical protein
MFSPTAVLTALAVDSAGFAYIDRTRFSEIFAQDVNPTEARVMAITQKPIAISILQEPIKAAAWKAIPSWYLVSANDHVINPDLERFFAKRMNAKTSETNASHVSFISQPAVAAQIIMDAAKTVAAQWAPKEKELVTTPT